jgi:hypothetical protein
MTNKQHQMNERITMKRKFRLLSCIPIGAVALCLLLTPLASVAADKNTEDIPDSVPAADVPDVPGSYVPDVIEQNTSTPRVIVTGFSTKPKKVMAGKNFNLVIHLRNTSKKTRVSNMLFTLSAPDGGEDAESSAPVFLPASGSNSIYLDGIKANGTADITIKLNAKSDLMQKPYSVMLSMVYEDAKANQYEATSNLSIPVKQEVRFEVGEFEISPSTVDKGNDVNVMCSVYNTGRVKLYNVKANFEGGGVNCPEVYLGNITPGANAAIDAMLSTKDAQAGNQKVNMTLTYEDETGKVSDLTKDFDLEVAETAVKEEEMNSEPEPQRGSSGVSFLPIVIIAVVVIAVIISIILLVRRKKKKALNAEEALFDEVD